MHSYTFISFIHIHVHPLNTSLYDICDTCLFPFFFVICSRRCYASGLSFVPHSTYCFTIGFLYVFAIGFYSPYAIDYSSIHSSSGSKYICHLGRSDIYCRVKINR
ncbi:hypothetical protein JOM56_007953, partial [Amanita muscaria]